MGEKILIVEDDKKLNDGIRLALKNDSCLFYQCRSLKEAREILSGEDIALVLLDVNLPDGNGIDFVKEIRKNSQVPIILLTVNNMEVDIVTGLDAGANDYITKPFSLMVLRARVAVQLRNKETTAGDFDTVSVILATGGKRSAPKIPGLKEFEGRGVSYCAVCDAFFYRGKEVAVVGNGEFALHEAEELRNVTQDVTIYTDGKEPEFSREHPIAVNTMKIQAIEGDDKVSGLLMQSDTAAQDAEAPENSFYPVDGVFVALGTAGSTEIARQMGAEITDKGNIKTDEEMATTIPGLFAAGDCTGGLLQVSKAVYEGSMAAISAGKYVRHKKVS